jgi:hypothetical protein
MLRQFHAHIIGRKPARLDTRALAQAARFGSVGNALDHDDEEHAMFIPSTQPAHPPAINVIAPCNRSPQPQKFRFNAHSPRRTCMARQRREVNANAQ